MDLLIFIHSYEVKIVSLETIEIDSLLDDQFETDFYNNKSSWFTIRISSVLREKFKKLF